MKNWSDEFNNETEIIFLTGAVTIWLDGKEWFLSKQNA